MDKRSDFPINTIAKESVDFSENNNIINDNLRRFESECKERIIDCDLKSEQRRNNNEKILFNLIPNSTSSLSASISCFSHFSSPSSPIFTPFLSKCKTTSSSGNLRQIDMVTSVTTHDIKQIDPQTSVNLNNPKEMHPTIEVSMSSNSLVLTDSVSELNVRPNTLTKSNSSSILVPDSLKGSIRTAVYVPIKGHEPVVKSGRLPFRHDKGSCGDDNNETFKLPVDIGGEIEKEKLPKEIIRMKNHDFLYSMASSKSDKLELSYVSQTPTIECTLNSAPSYRNKSAKKQKYRSEGDSLADHNNHYHD
jgi:hypothetical protein